MNALFPLIPPLLIAAVGIWGMIKRVDVFSALCDGALDGLKTVGRILPALAVMLPAVYMLRASGALEALCGLIAPVLIWLGIPPETAPLMLVRPISGSGALAVASELISEHGPNSPIGRAAAVMMGSTETTFYVVAVYFGAAGIRKSRHAIPSALVADLVGFAAASYFAGLLF